ncbi:hypothetical protein BC832DRAFT_592324 [Gaertneriomyces semiglobifer]|nr:hypothetical protein BC832DRAFT_592324 [Gaertneriomyces semiglobifer]
MSSANKRRLVSSVLLKPPRVDAIPVADRLHEVGIQKQRNIVGDGNTSAATFRQLEYGCGVAFSPWAGRGALLNTSYPARPLLGRILKSFSNQECDMSDSEADLWNMVDQQIRGVHWNTALWASSERDLEKIAGFSL